jgi:hypothetical protein
MLFKCIISKEGYPMPKTALALEIGLEYETNNLLMYCENKINVGLNIDH